MTVLIGSKRRKESDITRTEINVLKPQLCRRPGLLRARGAPFRLSTEPAGKKKKSTSQPETKGKNKNQAPHFSGLSSGTTR